MAYAVINKSGCVVRKGNVQLRLDFYLEPTDPRYDDRHLYQVDTTSAEYLAGYSGELNTDTSFVNQAAYELWKESLPHIWQNTPFHSHFLYLNPNFTEDDIKTEIDFHLPNFYKAFQDRWDEVKGGMRHGWATEKRIRPKNYSGDIERVAQCQNRIDSLIVFSYKPKGEEGKEYPATEIDIGSAATDRNITMSATYTTIDLANPANDTGTIDTFEIWADSNLDGTNKVGTFHGSGTDYTNRDGETIGTVTAGSKQTFTGLTIDVTTGDFAGIYFSAGTLERLNEGGSNIYWISGDQFGTGQQTYTIANGDSISLYGTGETPSGWATIAKVCGVAAADIAKINGVAVADIAKLLGTSV